MNRIQNNVYRMASATIQLLNDHDVLLKPFIVITEQKRKITDLLKEVELHKEGQEESDTTEQTRTKNELMADLVDRTAKVALKARGLAKVTGDSKLLNRVNFSRYDIADKSDQYSLDTVGAILKAVEEEKTALVQGYNLFHGEIDALEALAARVDTLITERRVSASSGKASTANLSEAIGELRQAWDVMDDLVEGIIEDEDFIETYNNSRRIGN